MHAYSIAARNARDCECSTLAKRKKKWIHSFSLLLLLIDADAHRIESNRMESLYKRPKSGVPCRVEQRSSGDVYTGHGNSKQWYDTSYLKKKKEQSQSKQNETKRTKKETNKKK
mmetsp:Transcript_29784/g.70132  ORF Transcript_29784/g.70132 Transcript_29784/m.70132 type:complete len:114 (-) Transcript_29784:27-368(-)